MADPASDGIAIAPDVLARLLQAPTEAPAVASGGATGGGIPAQQVFNVLRGLTPEGGIDFSRPVAEVRALIDKLPPEQRQPAIRQWADAVVARENAAAGPLGTLTNHARAIARGAPGVGPWLDEINAGGAGLLHTVSGGRIGAPYDEAIEYERARDRAHDVANPTLSKVEQVAGGMAGGLGALRLGAAAAAAGTAPSALGSGMALAAGGPFAMAAPAATALGRVAQGAATGAAVGANYGAGNAEGGLTPEGIAARGAAALEHGAVGGVLGGALSPVADVVGGAYRMATTPAARRAEDLMARRAAMDGSPGMEPAAQLRLYGDRAERLMAISPSARLADAGGENVGNLMRMANNVPNEMRDTTRKALDVRAAHQWKRLEDAVIRDGLDNVHLPPGVAANAPQNYYAGAEAMARKLDDIGMRRIQPTLDTYTPLTPQLAEVLMRKPMAPILQRVEAGFSAEGRMVAGLAANPAKKPVGETEFLFRLKLELDDLIGQRIKADKMGETPQAGWDVRSLMTLKKDLLDNIQNPAFKAGLKEYAGEAQMLSALEAGKKEFADLQASQLKMRLAEMRQQGPQHEAFYRVGALRDLVEQIREGNATNDRLKSVFGSPEMQMKIQALMPNPAAYRDFMRVVQVERKMAATRAKVQGNSSTAGQLTELQEATRAGDNALAVARIGGHLAAGHIRTAVTGIADRLGNSYARLHGVTPAVAEEVLKLGMSRDPRMLDRVLSRSPVREPDARQALVDAAMAAYAAQRGN